jgi:sec-independent protein translocase protein TatB
MFDIAWSELMLIGAVALVVIGPKDLPKALRTVGQTVGKVRRMASEFQGQFNDAMREAELHDLKKQVEDVGGSVSSAMNTDFKPIEMPNDQPASSGLTMRAERGRGKARGAALAGAVAACRDRARRRRDAGGRGQAQAPAQGAPSRLRLSSLLL